MNKHNSILKKVLFLFVALAFFGMSWAQTKAISGDVKDATGEPVIGASVVVTGTSVGTITDMNGKFRIEVTPNAKTLDITYVGMQKTGSDHYRNYHQCNLA